MVKDQIAGQNNDTLDGDWKSSQLHPHQAFDRAKCRNRALKGEKFFAQAFVDD